MPAPSIETWAGAMHPVARYGRPDEWLRRGRLDPKPSAWRCGRFQWILSFAPGKGAVPPGASVRAGYPARLPAVCAIATRLAAGALPSIAFQQAAKKGAAPRSRLPAARKVRPAVPAGGFPREQAWQPSCRWRWLWL